MMSKKNLLTLLGCLATLSGCGGSDSTSSNNSVSEDQVTVTAIDGYLYKANLYQQDEDGNCLIDGELLGTTNEQGQVDVELTDLANGYCVVATNETIDQDDPDTAIESGYTLYSPTPRLLGSADAPVISPFTSYIYQSVSDAKANDSSLGEDVIIATIETAKIALAEALEIDSADTEITDLFVSDYLVAKASETLAVQEAAEIAHTFAQLSIDLASDANTNLSAGEVINLAMITGSRLQDISDNDSEFEQVLSFLSARFDELSDDEQVEALQTAVSDTSILNEMPFLIADSDTLKTTITDLLESDTLYYDSEVGLDLGVVEFTGISTENAQLGTDSKLILSRSKINAVWGAEQVAVYGNSDEDSDTASYSNDILTPNSLVLVENGSFIYSLYVEKEIGEYTFSSNKVSFEVEVSEEQVANSAPVYNAESELVSTLITRFNNSTSIFDPSIYGLEGTAEFDISSDISVTEFAALFSDVNDDQEVTYVAAALSNGFESDPYIDDFLVSYGFSDQYTLTTKVLVPETDSQSYSGIIYAVDSLGAKSDNYFEFNITINADQSAVVSLDTTGNDNNIDNEVNYGELFYGAMIPDSYLAQLELQLETYLSGSIPDIEIELEQIIRINSFQCSDENTCTEIDGFAGDYMLDNNDYLTIIPSDSFNTLFTATDTSITTEQTVQLSAEAVVVDVDGIYQSNETVKLYYVSDSRSSEITGIDDYYSHVQLLITPDTGDGVSVTATLAND